MWKSLPSRRILKTLRESPKRIISTSDGLGLLQMVLESDTERCANEDVGPRRGVDCEIPHRLERGASASEDTEPRRGVDCEIPHPLERGTSASEDTKP